MSGQWSLLALAVAVATGLTTVTVTAVRVRSRQTGLFRYFLSQILLFNLLILSGLVVQSIDLSFRQQGLEQPAALLPGLLAALAALKLAWLYALTGMTLLLFGQRLPDWFARRVGSGAALAFVAWAAMLALRTAAGSSAGVGVGVGVLVALMEFVVLGAALAVCVALVVRAGSSSRGQWRRSAIVLGCIYLPILAVMIGSLTLGLVRATGQTPMRVVFNSTLMVLFNLLSLWWILRYQPLEPASEPDTLARFGITPREREIIEHIMAGRTNQEIADRLFVSLATVKDHVYNIFQRTGVRNRVELANLMGGRARPQTSHSPSVPRQGTPSA